MSIDLVNLINEKSGNDANPLKKMSTMDKFKSALKVSV